MSGRDFRAEMMEAAAPHRHDGDEVDWQKRCAYVCMLAIQRHEEHTKALRAERDHYRAEHDRLWEGNIEDTETIADLREALAALSPKEPTPEREVGCETDEGTMIIHPDHEVCEVCDKEPTK